MERLFEIAFHILKNFQIELQCSYNRLSSQSADVDIIQPRQENGFREII